MKAHGNWKQGSIGVNACSSARVLAHRMVGVKQKLELVEDERKKREEEDVVAWNKANPNA